MSLAQISTARFSPAAVRDLAKALAPVVKKLQAAGWTDISKPDYDMVGVERDKWRVGSPGDGTVMVHFGGARRKNFLFAPAGLGDQWRGQDVKTAKMPKQVRSAVEAFLQAAESVASKHGTEG